MKKNDDRIRVLEYLMDKYCMMFQDKQLVEKYTLDISPNELQDRVNNSKINTNERSNYKKFVKPKEIREEIKIIDDEEKLYNYFMTELIRYFDKSIEEKESLDTLKKISKEELIFLYRIISSAPIQKAMKKENILWLIKKYFDNKSRVEAMRL